MANILLVDDDEDLLHLARKLLASQKHTVMIARDALEAVDILGRYPFHLIVTDANMPHYSGFDFIKTVRKQESLKNVKVAMLTGRKEKKDIDHALKAGADDYIIKPIDPMLFLKKIERLLSEAHLETNSEIELGGAPLLSTAKMEFSIKLQSISEMGLVLNSQHPMLEGKLSTVVSPIFDEMQITPPHLKVLSCLPFKFPHEGYEIRLAFIGTDDTTLQKIRSWIFKTQIKRKVA